MKRIIAAALATGGALVAALILANQNDREPASCVEVQAAIVDPSFPGTKEEKLEFMRATCGSRVVKRPDGFFCRDGLLYGPGLGGVDAAGNFVTCTARAEDTWYPHEVSAGVVPEDIVEGKDVISTEVKDADGSK